MSRKETFVAPGLRLEWEHDRWNGWRVTAWRPHVSQVFTDRKTLLKFINWPPKTPTGDLIRGWIDGLIEQTPKQSLDTAAAEALSPELLATGFGPEVFAGELDPSDPNYQSRTVI
jgi:hypothetical protein